MLTINEYRADMLTILGDAGARRYTDSILDMGLREALGPYKAYFPRKETITMKAAEVNGTSVTLSGMLPQDAEIITIRTNSGNWLDYGEYRTDQKIYIQVYSKDYIPAAGETLKLEIRNPHTIKGFLNGTITTIPDTHENTVCLGASGYAMRIRARSITEVFGKRPEDREALMNQADSMITEYFSQLATLQPASHDPLPRGGFPV
jgi:hypothetical protein